MRFTLVFGLAAISAVAFALPAWTHHSHGNYEDTFMDIQGVVKEVHLVVPHSWIYLEVKDAKGEPQMWGTGSDRPHGTSANRSHAGLCKSRRYRQGAVPPSSGRFQRLPSRVFESEGWHGQRLGRQQRAGACRFLN